MKTKTIMHSPSGRFMLAMLIVVLGLAATSRSGVPSWMLTDRVTASVTQALGASTAQEPTKELARDDGTSAGRRSIAGGAHSVRFDAPSNDCQLTAVGIFGLRYGQATPPSEDTHIWLCDTDFKTLASLPFPYSTFERGEAQWITIPIT